MGCSFATRPKFALVFSLAILLGGAYCFSRLRRADYPELAPPVVTVTATYAGASPQVVADTVATPVEDQINGVENIYFFDSQCRDTGAYTLTITFRPGTDSDMNVVNVQNAVKRAEPKLPSEVVQTGINVAKASSDVVIRLAFTTDGSSMSLLELFNAVGYDIKNALQRVEGVTQVNVADHGGYAMRVWLDAGKMSALGIGVEDVKAAIEGQNIQPAAGFVGDSFSSDVLSYKINVRGRMVLPEEFSSIVVRTDNRTEARVVLGDIARCELGTGDYATEDYANGKLTAMLAVGADAKSNLLEISDRCKRTLAKWMERMPEGVSCEVQCDPSEFTRSILSRFGKALLIGCLMAMFALWILKGLRTALTTLLLIVLSLSCAAPLFLLFGLSVDVFSLLGIIFALGMLLGNGVLCSVAGERRSKRRLAGVSSVMFTGAVVTMVAYVPLVGHGGMVGMMYVRFALALCTVVLMSTLVATMILPAFASYLPGGISGLIAMRARNVIAKVNLHLALMINLHPLLSLVALIVPSILLFMPYDRIRKDFLPAEDRGYFAIECELPEGSSLVRTQEVALRVCDALKDVPGVELVTVGPGSTNLSKPGENHAAINCKLLPYADRQDRGLTIDAVVADVERRLAPISIAEFTTMYLPPINGMGGLGGVVAYACAVGSIDAAEQAADIEAYADWLRKLPQVKGVGTTLSATSPQLYFHADRDKALALGVSASAIFSTMQNQLASFYVNDFNYAGGAHQVLVQNEPSARRSVEDAMNLHFPGRDGAMVPISSIGRFEYVLGPRTILRYNKMPSAGIIITPADGVTTLDIVDIVEKHPPDPKKYVLNWSAMTLEECGTRGKIMDVFIWSVLLVFFVLVARYESWRLPLVVVVPSIVSVGGGMAGLWFFGCSLTLYAQLALLLLFATSVCLSLPIVDGVIRIARNGSPVSQSMLGVVLAKGDIASMAVLAFLVSLMTFWLYDGVGASSLRSAATPLISGFAIYVLLGVRFVVVLFAWLFGRVDVVAAGKFRFDD